MQMLETLKASRAGERSILRIGDHVPFFSIASSIPIHFVLLHSKKDRRVSRPTARLPTTFAALISPARSSTRRLSTLRRPDTFPSNSFGSSGARIRAQDKNKLQRELRNRSIHFSALKFFKRASRIIFYLQFNIAPEQCESH